METETVKTITVRESIHNGLLSSPDEIRAAEDRLHEKKLDLLEMKDSYEAAKYRLLLDVDDKGEPVINGKNEAQREAQLKSRLLAYHSEVRQAEEAAMLAEREYNYEINLFRSLRSVARLLSPEDD